MKYPTLMAWVKREGAAAAVRLKGTLKRRAVHQIRGAASFFENSPANVLLTLGPIVGLNEGTALAA